MLLYALIPWEEGGHSPSPIIGSPLALSHSRTVRWPNLAAASRSTCPRVNPLAFARLSTSRRPPLAAVAQTSGVQPKPFVLAHSIMSVWPPLAALLHIRTSLLRMYLERAHRSASTCSFRAARGQTCMEMLCVA